MRIFPYSFPGGRLVQRVVECNLLTSSGENPENQIRHVTRLTHALAVELSNEQYDKAADLCTKDAIWERYDGSESSIAEFYADLQSIPNKRAFYLIPIHGEEERISATEISLQCDVSQQIQTGIVDVGNYHWQVELTWEKTRLTWKVSRIRDLTERTYSETK